MSLETHSPTKRITDLLPLSPRACMVYLPELRLLRGLGNYGDSPLYSDIKIADQMEIENPVLLESIETRAEHFNDLDFELLYRRGSQIAYRIIQAQARLDSGIPAYLTPENIERYERDTYKDVWFEHIVKLNDNGHIPEADAVESDRFDEKREQLLTQLKQNEPFMISVLRQNLRNLPKTFMRFVEDGMIDTYFPFKVRQEVKRVRRIGKLKTT